MPLDERAQAMLREMGVRVWQPARRVVAPDAASREVPAAARPADVPHAEPLLPVPASPAPGAEAPGRSVAAESTSPTSAADLSTLDWPQLRDAVAACRACSLSTSRRQTVFGVGHPRAHWMIVGEAPGEQEDLRGEPFVGPAGRLLDNMLRAIGLTRAQAAGEGEPPLEPAQQVYIANTLKCRPPGNRNPERSEMERCEPFLLRQLELVQPRLIVAMGRFAVQALLRTEEAIGRLRGRMHLYHGVPLIVTYHPAYLLRNPPDKARAWEDLCLARATMQAQPVRPAGDD
jgi:DNA polymerase